jgi:mersacidin/lichenicidin family type 2 lantibiotic
MSSDDLVRAWKDPEHRDAYVDEHPAGEIALDRVVGGNAITLQPTCFTALALCTFDIGGCNPQTMPQPCR